MTNRDESISLRRQICDLLALGRFTVREVADRLGVQSRAEVKQVRDAILELAREGRVRQMFSERPEGWVKTWGLAEPKVSVQARIWRACLLKSQKGPFTTADLIPLVQGEKGAAVSRDYAKRYVRFLLAAGYLIRPPGKRGNAAFFLVAPGKEKAPAPHWNRRAEKRAKEEPAQPAPPEVGKVLAGVGKFIAEVKEILGETNVRVQVVLDGMETDLARVQALMGGGPGALKQ
jgi:hypothetical protein